MENIQSPKSLQHKIRNVRPLYWMIGGLLFMIVAASFVISAMDPKISPGSWSCDNIKPVVIDISKDEYLTIFEIGEVIYSNNLPNYELKCSAGAETSAGYGLIEYGAHVTDGGSVIVTYQRK